MNKRQWKKACKKAAARLVQEHCGRLDIRPALGNEVLRAPNAYVEANPAKRIMGQYVKAPKGLLVVWERASAWEPEPECRSALEVANEKQAELRAHRSGYSRTTLGRHGEHLTRARSVVL